MGVIVGSGEYRYEVIEGWGKLPDGWTFREVAAVGVDKNDNVYCFTRGDHPVIVFDRDGNFLRSWGEGVFKRAHGATIGADDTIYLTDDGDHTVRKCTLVNFGSARSCRAVPGRRAFQPLHPRGVLARGRYLRFRRLWQLARAQVFARWQAALFLGRAGLRSRAVQYRA